MWCWGCKRATIDREHAGSQAQRDFIAVSQHWICEQPVGFNLDCCVECGDLFLKWVKKHRR